MKTFSRLDAALSSGLRCDTYVAGCDETARADCGRNRDTREMYSLYLPMAGYSVETAAEGREAVIKALTLYPDVIVMDLQMPGVDGWRAMREICGNARTAGTPVIVLTGHDFKNYLGHSAFAEGAFAYLMKPCLPERLAQEIDACLRTVRSKIARAG